ncbi:MAG: formylglycine-generating enzyme family protein [Planctomycetota bacterium]
MKAGFIWGVIAILIVTAFAIMTVWRGTQPQSNKPVWRATINIQCTKPAPLAGQAAPAGFTKSGVNPQGYQEYRHDQTGMVFVLIPGGQFLMGTDDGRDNEKPVHDVWISSFLIAKYETTQGQWQKVMGYNISSFGGSDDYPVDYVSWNHCDEFCTKTGLRLPTEAEWEYACRAGTKTKFYWGDEPDNDYMWYSANSGGTTHPVGQKKPNGFGLYDITGNLWEWCQDWWQSDYYKTFSPSAEGGSASGGRENPKGPAGGQARVLRGGSWDFAAEQCRSAYHSGSSLPENQNPHYGFRCARSLD